MRIPPEVAGPVVTRSGRSALLEQGSINLNGDYGSLLIHVRVIHLPCILTRVCDIQTTNGIYP